MRWHIALLAGCLLAVPAGAADIVFRVEQAAGLNLDAPRLQQLLASPEIEVRITYAPLLAWPGWTGRLGVCGVSDGRADICLKKRWRSLHLRGDRITRRADSLRFHVPEWQWFGLMPYRPAGPLRVSLPAFWPGSLPVNVDTDLLTLPADVRPLADLHLPAPYSGIASWQRLSRRGGERVLPPWQVAACDPVVELAGAVQPRRRRHLQAESYAEWLRALAASEWWARQIDGVQWQQGEQDGVTWRRVSVQRGAMTLQHLQVEEPRLPQSRCPGTTRHEFAWRDGRLLAARWQAMADPFADMPGCEVAAPAMEEAVWDGEQVLAFRRSGHELSHDGRDAICAAAGLDGAAATAAAGPLQQAAGHWWQRFGARP